jgi:phosphofructokinase-like protein
MTKRLGILTSGGDCPGLNAAIRGIGKAARRVYGMDLVGFHNGFRGLVYDETIVLDDQAFSGILTDGGTILGTSRDKPHRMPVDGKVQDMIEEAAATYHRHALDGLICLGGGGTQKNALRLKEAGLNILTLPKTIDNDIAMTDVSFGFDTAVSIATEAIDRLHSTATSHNRIMVVEIMGHRAGWLALEAGMAGGADVILIPEIPYNLERVAQAIQERARRGSRFSIVAVAEGAMSDHDAQQIARVARQKKEAKNKADKEAASAKLRSFQDAHVGHTVQLTEELARMTGQESRLSILGHLQRGGTPSAADRVLATRLGTACAQFANEGRYGYLLALQNNQVQPVPLEEVAGNKKLVPVDHPMVEAARLVGTSFGD